MAKKPPIIVAISPPIVSSVEKRRNWAIRKRHSIAYIRELLVFAFFIVAAIALTWPLVRNFSRAIPDVGDPYVSISIFDWNVWATFHDPTRLFHQPIFHPARYALAFTEHLYGIAMLVAPAFLAGVSSVAAYNISFLLGYAFCGYGAYVLCRTVTGSIAASVAGGVFFAFMPYRITQLPHISYIWAGWLPLLFAALIHYARRPTWRRAVLFSVAFFLNGITCLHWLAMGGLAIVVCIAFLWGVYRHDGRFPLRLAATGGVASLALLPFLVPYQRVGKLYGMKRRVEEAEMFSADLTDWFVGGPHLPYSQFLNFSSVNPERWLFTGFPPLALAITAVFLMRRDDLPREDLRFTRPELPRRLVIALDLVAIIAAIATVFVQLRPFAPAVLTFALLVRWSPKILDRAAASRFPAPVWIAIILILIGFFGSLGLNTFFHSFLFEYLRPFRSIRVSARWAMVAYVGISVLVSCGVLALMRRYSGAVRKGIPVAAAMLMLIEFSPAPLRWYLAPVEPPLVYRWLREAPVRGAILELPIATGASEYEYLFRARHHKRPMLNGVSSFTPPDFERLVEMAHAKPISDRFTLMIESLGCAFVIVHADRLIEHDQSTREWLRRSVSSGRLSFVRRLPHHNRGDYVFAVNRVAPHASFLREHETPDRSGSTPSQHLQRFLDANPYTYFDTAIGLLDSPLPYQIKRGELHVSGWAAAPGGVERVRLRFAGDSVTEDAELFSRPELGENTVGYPPEFATGFRRTFRYRPEWTHQNADLIVEIVGRSGDRAELEPVFFTWRERLDIDDADWRPEELTALLRRLGVLRAGSLEALSINEIVNLVLEDARNESDTRFLLRCYRVLLNRHPERGALEQHLGRLRAGTTRREVLKAFLRSGEFQRVHLRE